MIDGWMSEQIGFALIKENKIERIQEKLSSNDVK